MTGPLQQRAPSVSDAELCHFVESSLANFNEDSARLIRLDRKLYEYHSSFAIEELTAHFDDEKELALIFKNLNFDGLLEEARRVRPQFAYQPDREITVYREILANAGMGTATCYGCRVDPRRGRYWLLLEKVAGDELYKIESFSTWCDVARWLANLHCRMADVAPVRQRDARLSVYDEDFYNSWIDRAERFVGECEGPVQRSAMAARMKWLGDQGRTVARDICRLPVTLLHGDFYASNILIAQLGNRTRICPVDWEAAAIGPGLMDLAALIAGSWTEQQKQELATAYYEALSPANEWKDRDDLIKALRWCRLFLAIKWLGWSPDWRPPAEHRCDWLAEALQLAEQIDSDQD